MSKAVLVTLLAAAAALAGDVAPVVQLPKPVTTGGMPLMRALAERKSARDYTAQKLPPQVLSNLLWAAYGQTRADGRRTAPSAKNAQTVDIYVTLPEGLYLYDVKEHRLDLVVPGDLRAAAGVQPFVAEAALNLVYVADMTKLTNPSFEDTLIEVAAETGLVGENVYLFCASEGLSTVIRIMIDRPALAKAMKLRPEQRIILGQSVGYPKPAAAAR